MFLFFACVNGRVVDYTRVFAVTKYPFKSVWKCLYCEILYCKVFKTVLSLSGVKMFIDGACVPKL